MATQYPHIDKMLQDIEAMHPNYAEAVKALVAWMIEISRKDMDGILDLPKMARVGLKQVNDIAGGEVV